MYVRGILALIGIVLALYFIIAASKFNVHQRSGPMAAGIGGPSVTVVIDDAQTGVGTTGLFYRGNWEHVRGRPDGRNGGTSSRSRNPGDAVSLVFRGSALAVYGVTGPNGGVATVKLDETRSQADFYSPEVGQHELVYDARDLSPGLHVLTLTVQHPTIRGRAYVDLDDIEIAAVPNGG